MALNLMKQIFTLFWFVGLTGTKSTARKIEPGGDTTTGLPLSNITNIEYGSIPQVVKWFRPRISILQLVRKPVINPLVMLIMEDRI
jgi:hypothetical protein